jgi:hypothetical protein
LDETDSIWAAVRNWHISEVMEYVTEKFQKFREENKAAQWEMSGGARGATKDIDALKDVMHSFGDYQATKEIVGRHMTMCLHVSKVFERRKLEGVVDLEQNLAITEASDSKFSKLIKQVDGILADPTIE